MKIDVIHLSDDQIVRRFVELPKLFELLAADRIFFPTVATFKAIDPFECSIPLRQAIRRVGRRTLEREAMSSVRHLPAEYQTGDVVADYERSEKIIKRTSLENLRKHVAEMRLTLARSRIVCNCWHADTEESDAMWKVYAGNIGVMLVSTVGRLKTAIKGSYSNLACSPNPQEYVIAPIRYVDPTNVGRLPKFYVERPWLLKRTSFAHEKEIRVSHELPWIIFEPESRGMLIQIGAERLISEIVLSPFNSEWADRPIATAIIALLKQRSLSIPIRKSGHMRAPRYESTVLDHLSLLKLRDMTGGGEKLKMIRPKTGLEALTKPLSGKPKPRRDMKRTGGIVPNGKGR